MADRLFQRPIRWVLGIQYTFNHQKELNRNLILAGAEMEMALRNHELATVKWLENLQGNYQALERQNNMLRKSLLDLQERLRDVEERLEEMI